MPVKRQRRIQKNMYKRKREFLKLQKAAFRRMAARRTLKQRRAAAVFCLAAGIYAGFLQMSGERILSVEEEYRVEVALPGKEQGIKNRVQIVFRLKTGELIIRKEEITE